jgi:hypothetical protein
MLDQRRCGGAPRPRGGVVDLPTVSASVAGGASTIVRLRDHAEPCAHIRGLPRPPPARAPDYRGHTHLRERYRHDRDPHLPDRAQNAPRATLTRGPARSRAACHGQPAWATRRSARRRTTNRLAPSSQTSRRNAAVRGQRAKPEAREVGGGGPAGRASFSKASVSSQRRSGRAAGLTAAAAPGLVWRGERSRLMALRADVRRRWRSRRQVAAGRSASRCCG